MGDVTLASLETPQPHMDRLPVILPTPAHLRQMCVPDKETGMQMVSKLPKTTHSDNGAGTTPRPSMPSAWMFPCCN